MTSAEAVGLRLQDRLRAAVDDLLLGGTNPWELDEAMVEHGFAMGPNEAQDLVGLDVAYNRRKTQPRDPKRRYVLISDRMVQEGRLGRKVGVGWYRYPGGGGKVIDPLVEDLCREEAHFARVTRRDFTDAEICERLVLAMIHEAAALLGEGVKANQIDAVSPAYLGTSQAQGGLIQIADRLGPKAVMAKLQDLANQSAVDWTPGHLVTHCAAKGISFADFSGSGSRGNH